MNTTLAALVVFGCLVAAVVPGRIFVGSFPKRRRTKRAARDTHATTVVEAAVSAARSCKASRRD